MEVSRSENQQKKHPLANSPERFLNRELSLLSFNIRVLEESNNERHPLLERLKFLAISASNMDEFYMVRVAGLKFSVRMKDTKLSNDGLTPEQQLELIEKKSAEIIKLQQESWTNIRKALAKENIEVVKSNELSKSDMKWLKEHFTTNIYPALTPIAIDPAHPFPFLPNLALAVILKLKRSPDTAKKIRVSEKDFHAVIPLPQKIKRFTRLPETDENKKIRFITLEDILEIFQGDLFPGCKVIESGVLRVTRDSDLEKIQDAEDLVSSFESALKRRKRGNVIRLKVTSMAKDLLDFISDEFNISTKDISYANSGTLGLSNIMELYDVARPELKFKPINIRFPERILDYGGDCLAAIHAKDIVVHHPYESFDVVVQFLKQAAKDPEVVAIKQTLYRTSNDSPIVKALIEAAEAGKSVTALVELKARFDEEANINWAKNMERAGVQVIFGFVNLKTHAKISLVVRRVGENLQSYVHYGTGNYHPITAKVYSDLSFFTSDAALCRDAAHLFNYLTGYSPPEKFEKIAIAPLSLRSTILQCIEDEKNHARAGRKAEIWFKVNSLVDAEIIDALYDASQAGVSINLVVRGICCLKPGIKGFSDNIRVKSIVGRFLEHSRIFCFGMGKGMPSPEAKIYISSADLMPRNLDWRVEVIVPIENPTVHEQIMGQIMVANLKDEKQTWHLQSDGSYTRQSFKENSFSAHEFFINNPSLSGRGTALHGKPKKV